jgi:hypothetical protein
LFGFCAQGFHAGLAVYFPELFPTHLQVKGAGFCFNTGEYWPLPFGSGVQLDEVDDGTAAGNYIAGHAFPLGLLVLAFLPENKDKLLIE